MANVKQAHGEHKHLLKCWHRDNYDALADVLFSGWEETPALGKHHDSLIPQFGRRGVIFATNKDLLVYVVRNMKDASQTAFFLPQLYAIMHGVKAKMPFTKAKKTHVTTECMQVPMTRGGGGIEYVAMPKTVLLLFSYKLAAEAKLVKRSLPKISPPYESALHHLWDGDMRKLSDTMCVLNGLRQRQAYLCDSFEQYVPYAADFAMIWTGLEWDLTKVTDLKALSNRIYEARNRLVKAALVEYLKTATGYLYHVKPPSKDEIGVTTKDVWQLALKGKK